MFEIARFFLAVYVKTVHLPKESKGTAKHDYDENANGQIYVNNIQKNDTQKIFSD